MENRNSNKDFYVIKSRNLAYALKWIGFDYYKYPSTSHNGKNVYSFVRDDKFNKVLDVLMELKLS